MVRPSTVRIRSFARNGVSPYVRSTVTESSHRDAPKDAVGVEMVVPSDGPARRATAIQETGVTQATTITASLRVRNMSRP